MPDYGSVKNLVTRTRPRAFSARAQRTTLSVPISVGQKARQLTMAITVAEQAAQKLAELGIANDGERLPTYRYTVTDIPLRFQTIGERFLGRSLGTVEKVDW